MGDTTAPAFGELLKKHRVGAGISQESLAERARVSASAISALERGARRAPYRDTVALVSTALGLSPIESAELEAAAERARGRQPRTAGEAPERHNLPMRMTSFVGREHEIVKLKEMLEQHRLVTITGSGGVGKTRTVVHVARQLLGAGHDEAWFVDLAPLGNGAFVAEAIASVLGIAIAENANALSLLAAQLKTRRMLLLLDNCEHVIQAAAAAALVLLQTCPHITILATSRERLAIAGEHVYQLPSMPVPNTAPATSEEAFTYASFRLLIERARAVDAHFELPPAWLETGADICRRLEGVPLAIELAATRLPALGFAALNERLKDSFAIGAGARDLPQRQQTMLATIAWSYELLSEQERVLLRRLAIFQGGLVLDAAVAVCADDALPAGVIHEVIAFLVDKSLLNVTAVGEQIRYVMLESVRAFASRKLAEAGEQFSTARAHAIWLAIVSDLADARLAEMSPQQWLAEFGAEIDNVRAALGWSLQSGNADDALLAARIVGGLRGLWIMTERRVECRGWVNAVHERIDVTSHPSIAARLMLTELQVIEQRENVVARWEQALPLFKETLGSRLYSLALAACAVKYVHSGDFEKADGFITRAFAVANENGAGRSGRVEALLSARCFISAATGRVHDARTHLTEYIRLRKVVDDDDDPTELNLSALIEFVAGDAERAAEIVTTAIARGRKAGRNASEQLHSLAAMYLVLGKVDVARATVLESLELAGFENKLTWQAIWHLSAIAAVRGNPRAAARLFGFARAASGQATSGDPIERSSYGILMESLRVQLPADTITALMGDGAQLDLVRAIDEALSALP